ncbi:hypothetical protein ACFPL7_02020, partial [Dongia soli]|uniref:hypothetical protein n=1 Tax=Dongia soli TaxID=600628 RepID=UPI003620D221
MKPLSKIDMGEVTRLTREGKLQEAMALLRREAPLPSHSVLRSKTSPEAAPGMSSVIDLVPQPSSAGDVWASPEPRQNSQAPRPTGFSGIGTPDTYRRFIDDIKRKVV